MYSVSVLRIGNTHLFVDNKLSHGAQHSRGERREERESFWWTSEPIELELRLCFDPSFSSSSSFEFFVWTLFQFKLLIIFHNSYEIIR